eukprot:PhM_4_TR4626/c0_g1_i2/m.43102
MPGSARDATLCRVGSQSYRPVVNPMWGRNSTVAGSRSSSGASWYAPRKCHERPSTVTSWKDFGTCDPKNRNALTRLVGISDHNVGNSHSPRPALMTSTTNGFCRCAEHCARHDHSVRGNVRYSIARRPIGLNTNDRHCSTMASRLTTLEGATRWSAKRCAVDTGASSKWCARHPTERRPSTAPTCAVSMPTSSSAFTDTRASHTVLWKPRSAAWWPAQQYAIMLHCLQRKRSSIFRAHVPHVLSPSLTLLAMLSGSNLVPVSSCRMSPQERSSGNCSTRTLSFTGTSLRSDRVGLAHAARSSAMVGRPSRAFSSSSRSLFVAAFLVRGSADTLRAIAFSLAFELILMCTISFYCQ